ncbi:MAG: hypothetical protein KDB02_14515 [Acidimicrobiales bacterium]|nr:hypothetical protein [Acidimicrobiales bacterium]
MPTDQLAPSSSTRPRRRLGYVVAAVVVAVVSITGCSKAPKQDELVDALMRAGLDRTEAKCAAAAVYDNLSKDQIEAIAERGASAVLDDSKNPNEPIDKARKEISECRTDYDVTTTTTVTSTSSTPVTMAPAETSVPTTDTEP